MAVPTLEQYEDLAKALCSIMRVPGVNWPNPFIMDLHPNMVPLEDIDQVWDDFFQIDGEPDIHKARLIIKVSGRRCLMDISMLGRMPGINPNKSEWRHIGWVEVME